MHPSTPASLSAPGIARLRRGWVAATAVPAIGALATLLSCADFGTPFVPEVATVSIPGPAQRSLRTGENLDLVADVRDAAGNPIPGAAVEWISSAAGTATVESRGALSGRASAAAVGNAMIVARSRGITSSPLELIVLQRDAASVAITAPMNPMTLPVGQSAQFSAEVRDDRGQLLPDQPLTWLSSNPNVMSIDAAGRAQAVAPGSATIQAQSGNALSAGVSVTVPAPAPSYAAVIQPIWDANCTRCHGFDGGLSLSGNAYDRIVNIPSTQNGRLQRILPGDPDNSYILRKLEGCNRAGCVGGGMPPGSRLSNLQLQLIRDWILGGCPR